MKRLATALLGASLLFAGSWSANAAVINLTLPNSTGTDAYNGSNVVFSQTALQPAGTGVFDTFVQIEAQGNGTTEQGYNTTASAFDNKNSAQHNHEITVGQVGFITVGGNQYMRFALDINEQGNNNKSGLTIDELQLFISTNPNQAVTTFDGAGLVNFSNATTVYRLDSGSNDSILLDADAVKGPGSGVADMFMDIPIALFQNAFTAGGFNTTGAQNGAYIYLYTAASNVDAGFEEWGARTGTPIPPSQVPEPMTLSMMGIGLLAIARIRRRRN